jgi:DNA (cytosine-5)-methyltransferase 1
MDNKQFPYAGLRELALFAGSGGGILGGKLLGWKTVCAVELEPYPASVLAARQNEGLLESFPIWDDVKTFNGKPWRGLVDVVSGGFPCQDISIAGKGAGITGSRSGLWTAFARIIREVQPRYAFIENSPMLVARGLSVVLQDLAKMGYGATWGIISAKDVGANHLRKRIWILAYSLMHPDNRKKLGSNEQEDYLAGKLPEEYRSSRQSSEASAIQWSNSLRGYVETDMANSKCEQNRRVFQRGIQSYAGAGGIRDDISDTYRKGLESLWSQSIRPHGIESRGKPLSGYWWEIEPLLGRVVDGLPHRNDRLKALGNAQVPLCAATAFKVLYERLPEEYRG